MHPAGRDTETAFLTSNREITTLTNLSECFLPILQRKILQKKKNKILMKFFFLRSTFYAIYKLKGVRKTQTRRSFDEKCD